MPPDGGAMLLKTIEDKHNIMTRLAECFTDYRDPARLEHSAERLVAQRVFRLCLGYEDCNDHNRLRDDAVLALAVGCPDVTGNSEPEPGTRGIRWPAPVHSTALSWTIPRPRPLYALYENARMACRPARPLSLPAKNLPTVETLGH